MCSNNEIFNMKDEDSEDDDCREYYMPAYSGEYDIKKKIIEANEALFAEPNVEQLSESTVSSWENKKIVKFGTTTICYQSDDESDSNASNDSLTTPSTDYFNQSSFLESDFNEVYNSNDKVDIYNNNAHLEDETEVAYDATPELTEIKYCDTDYMEKTFQNQNNAENQSEMTEIKVTPKDVMEIFMPVKYTESVSVSTDSENNIDDLVTVQEKVYDIKDSTPTVESEVATVLMCTKDVNSDLNCYSEFTPTIEQHTRTFRHHRKRTTKNKTKKTLQSDIQQSHKYEANEEAFRQWIRSKTQRKRFVRPKDNKNTNVSLQTQTFKHIQSSLICNPIITDTGKGVLKIEYIIHCLPDT